MWSKHRPRMSLFTFFLYTSISSVISIFEENFFSRTSPWNKTSLHLWTIKPLLCNGFEFIKHVCNFASTGSLVGSLRCDSCPEKIHFCPLLKSKTDKAIEKERIRFSYAINAKLNSCISINNKCCSLHDLIIEDKFDILCLAETWLREDENFLVSFLPCTHIF